MAFYGFLRCGEYTTRSLSFNPEHDVTFTDLVLEDHMYTINLKHSKTDRLHQGTQFCITRNNTAFCPFSSMLKFLLLCSPTLQSVRLFICKPMTRSWFSSKLCQNCGLPSDYSSPHSLRIAACSCIHAQIPGLLLILCLSTLHLTPQEGNLVSSESHEL